MYEVTHMVDLQVLLTKTRENKKDQRKVQNEKISLNFYYLISILESCMNWHQIYTLHDYSTKYAQKNQIFPNFLLSYH